VGRKRGIGKFEGGRHGEKGEKPYSSIEKRGVIVGDRGEFWKKETERRTQGKGELRALEQPKLGQLEPSKYNVTRKKKGGGEGGSNGAESCVHPPRKKEKWYRGGSRSFSREKISEGDPQGSEETTSRVRTKRDGL